MRRSFVVSIGLASLILATPIATLAAGGPLGIDRRGAFDDSGIWSRTNQQALIATLMVSEAGLALWEGSDTRLGKTSWQAIDATLLSGVSSLMLKKAFSRQRPSDTSDPNKWFSGGNNASFPSGEVTVTSAIVTPFVLEYAKEYPAFYALELFPLYDAVARVKTWGHWQTDVIAGLALGTTVGFLMHERETPLVLSVLPKGVYVGYSKRW